MGRNAIRGHLTGMGRELWMVGIGCVGTEHMWHYHPGGGGVCAYVQLNDHTEIVSIDRNVTRRRRDVALQEPTWRTKVYGQQGNKILFSLFPQFGFGQAMLRLDSVNYRISALVNEPVMSQGAQKYVLTALRLMTLWN